MRKALALAVLGALALIVPLTAGAAGRDNTKADLRRALGARRFHRLGQGRPSSAPDGRVLSDQPQGRGGDRPLEQCRLRHRRVALRRGAGRCPQPARGRGARGPGERSVRNRADGRAACKRQGQRLRPPPWRRAAGAARGAVRRPPVGHEGDPRDRRQVLPPPAGQQRRAGGDPRHGHRRVASRHRAELQPGAQPQLHHRRPAHRRRLRRRPGRLLHRPRRRGRGRSRHARGRHRGRADQPARHGGRGPRSASS